MSIELWLDQKPSSAGIDPLHKLIDRNLENNMRKLGEKRDNSESGADPGITINF